MSTIEPNPAPPPSDNGLCETRLVTGICKAIVRAARPQDRWGLWAIFERGIEGAQEDAQRTGRAGMPWELVEEVSYITWQAVQDVLQEALLTLPEVEERQRLVRVAAKAFDELTVEGTGKPVMAGRYGIKTCALPGCGQEFAARSRTHAFCSGNHRAVAYKRRKAARAFTAGDPGT